jgi:hypothetical protein
MRSTREQTDRAMTLRVNLRNAGVPAIITTHEAAFLCRTYGVTYSTRGNDIDAVSLAKVVVYISRRSDVSRMLSIA